MNKNSLFKEIEEYARENKVPIIEKEGLEVLEKIIKENTPINILEIGTAIGYSALKMNDIYDSSIVTFERNVELIKIAKNNIYNFKKTEKIKIISEDFLEYDVDDLQNKYFDLIYIDGAKAQYYNFFKHIESKIGEKTVVVFDNLNFHGFVHNEKKKSEASKNLKQLIKKLENFLDKIKLEKEYSFEYIEQGDGIGVLRKRSINEKE